MKRAVVLFVLISAALVSAQQQIVISASGAGIQSISVSASPSTIIKGATSTLTAFAIDSNGAQNINITYQCAWSSSNPAIISVNGNIATGVSSGTATVNCTEGGIVGSTPATVVVSNMVFTNPVQSTCANPCILPRGTNGTAYSFTFAATSSAPGPITYSVSAGSIPAWASLNAGTGALTGTPNANATTNFTIRATDSAANTDDLPVSLTIVAAVACGPPAYACSSTSTSNPGTIAAPFTSTQPSGMVNTQTTSTGLCTVTGSRSCAVYVSGTPFSTSWPAQQVKINGTFYTVVSWNSDNTATLSTSAGAQTGVAYVNYAACLNNCQNATFYDTSINPSGTDCITRITDGATFNFGKSVGNMTQSGGDNDVYSSLETATDVYIGATSVGGATGIFHLNITGNCAQVINTGHVMTVTTLRGFSKVVQTRFYYLLSNTQLWQGDITSDTTFTSTKLVDLTAAGVCPGVNWATFGTPTSASILGISTNDDTFAWSVGPGGQGSADWSFAWSRTKGCAAVNFKTGTPWAFCASGCSSSTLPLGTFNPAIACYGSNGATGAGIHDSQMSGDGQYLFVSQGAGAPWTLGTCAGQTFTTQYSVWQIGTLGDQYAYGANTIGVGGPNLGAHESVGVSHVASPANGDYNYRLNSALSSFTNFIPTLNVQDAHYSWAHPLNDDSYPWVGATDAQLAASGQSSGCTFEPACPTYLVNTIVSTNPTGSLSQTPILFAHTYSCNPTGAIYAKCASGVGDAFGSGDAIGFVTSKGNFFCWASSLLQSMGLDNTGALRVDAFCVRLQ